MIFSLFRRKTPDPGDLLYVEIVAQARQPGFYLDLCVPDTVEGRFEMILLHLALTFHRLKGESSEARKVAQKVADAFFLDMDSSLREMGIGDISVPKKIKKLADAYNGRSIVYARALDDRDQPGLAAAILRNVMAIDADQATPTEALAAGRIAQYALQTVDLLAAEPVAAILAGHLVSVPVTIEYGAEQ